MTFVRSVGADCRPDSVNQQILFCSLGLMRAGDRKTFDIYVRVDPSVPAFTSLTNTALALSGQSNTTPPGPPPNPPTGGPTQTLTWDPNTIDNTSTNFTTVNAVGDRFVTKRDVPAEPRLVRPFEPDVAIAGREHRYLITLGNNGPSNVVNATLTDSMDFKQTNIPGETFVRCEPLDPDDLVTCTPTAPGGANTFSLTTLRIANDLIFNGGLGTLPASRTIQFYAVTLVDPGYFLDAQNTQAALVTNSEAGAVARNTAVVGATTTDLRVGNNTDTERTAIIAEADLAVTKRDDAAGFLSCDPVAPGGVVNYTIVVSNTGPSDAAQVFVVDQLATDFLVVDPALVTVTVSRGQVVEKRDDGRITVIAGNDANNLGIAELGRLNAGSAPVTVTITATVRQSAACGGTATNNVRVETRANNTTSTAATAAPPWPLVITGPPQGNPAVSPTTGRTPTLDPNGANNSVTETTTIACPALLVDKTISFNGLCPGNQGPITYVPGSPVTYCFRITNSGTTFLDTIFLVDVLRTRSGTTVLFTTTITGGLDPAVPLAPGEVVSRTITLPSIPWDQCGTFDDVVTVTANPVNSGRTDLPCLSNVTVTDLAGIDVTCAGLDFRLQLPVLNSAGCKSWVTVQNVGNAPTKAFLVVWGDAGACPPQAAGPLKAECSGLLKPGSAWTFAAAGNSLPAGAKSAFVYAMNAVNIVKDERGNELVFADLACETLFQLIVGSHGEWLRFDNAYRQSKTYFGPIGINGNQVILEFGKNRAEPLTTLVDRACPDAGDPNVTSHASYVGVSTDGEGSYDFTSGGYTYYAPLVFASKSGLNSWLYIQNSGTECSSLELWFKAQDNCLRPILGDVLSLAPGETIHFDPNTVVGPDWVGSVWIRSSQPLGIVVDTMGANHFTSYNGVPGDVADDPLRFFSIGAQVNYAPLIYSEYQGWDTAIQVQNLSAIVPAKVKVYFLDRVGRHHHDAGGLGLSAGQPDVLPAAHCEPAGQLGGQRAGGDAGVGDAGEPGNRPGPRPERGDARALGGRAAERAARGGGVQRADGVHGVRLAAGQRHRRHDERVGGDRAAVDLEGEPWGDDRDRDHERGAQARQDRLRDLPVRPERAVGLHLPGAEPEAGGVHRPEHVRVGADELPGERGDQRDLLGARRVRRWRSVRAQPGRSGGGERRADRRGAGRARPAGRRVQGLGGHPAVRLLHGDAARPLPRSAQLPVGRSDHP